MMLVIVYMDLSNMKYIAIIDTIAYITSNSRFLPTAPMIGKIAVYISSITANPSVFEFCDDRPSLLMIIAALMNVIMIIAVGSNPMIAMTIVEIDLTVAAAGSIASMVSEYLNSRNRNLLTSKAGLDFGFNIGADKAWQVNVKPAYIWALTDGARASEYDNKFAHLELTAGVTYKFKNSNGTHNFVLVKEYDQAEVDGLNAKINDLRNQLGAKDQKIAADAAAIKKLQDELNDCRNKKVPTPPVVDPGKTVNQLETNVFFAQGKSIITAAQQPNVERVASFLKSHPAAKVAIKGYASPEGGKAINDKLSKARANAVKDMLVKKYKVDASRIVSVEGCGVGDIFSEPTWNRVAVSTLSE